MYTIYAKGEGGSDPVEKDSFAGGFIKNDQLAGFY